MRAESAQIASEMGHPLTRPVFPAPRRSFVPFLKQLRSRSGRLGLGQRDAPSLSCYFPSLVPARVSVVCRTRYSEVQGVEHSLVADRCDGHLAIVRGVHTPWVLALAYRAHQSDGPERLGQVHPLEDPRVARLSASCSHRYQLFAELHHAHARARLSPSGPPCANASTWST